MIYFELFYTFFKIGLFTFGGGYAMLPLIQEEIVKKGWMTLEELVNFIAVSESSPGPFAVNVSTYIGAEMSGILGAVCATLGVILPSFLIILLVASLFKAFSNNKYVRGALSGLKPAVIGLIGSAVVSVGKSVFFPTEFALSQIISFDFLFSAIIFVIMLVFVFKKVHPIIVVLASAALDIICGFIPV